MDTSFDTSRLAAALAPLHSGQTLVVGYSGGLDSTVLLHALVQARHQGLIKANIRCLHVNHGINPSASRWQQHCHQTCRHWQVEMSIADAGFQPGQIVSEEQLRHARYRCFEEQLAVGEVLLLAHHAEDQAETLLYRLMRGAGIAGAAAMPVTRALGRGALYRPLLAFRKSQLRDYALFHQLEWIEDDSNLDLNYDRNFLRHSIRPLLEQRWPAAVSNLLRFSHICDETHHTLDYLLDQYLPETICNSGRFPLGSLEPHPQVVQKQLVERWLERAGLKSLTQAQRQEIWQKVVHAAADAQPCFEWSGQQVRRYHDHLYLVPSLPEFDPQQVIDWQADHTIEVAGASLRAEAVKGKGLRWLDKDPTLRLSFRQGGARCQPEGRNGSRLLKKLLQEYDVPPWWRDRLPLIYQGDQLVAVAGLWICEGFQATGSEEGRVFHWTPLAKVESGSGC